MFLWSAADDRRLRGITPIDQLDDGFLQLRFDDDNTVTWPRCGDGSIRKQIITVGVAVYIHSKHSVGENYNKLILSVT